MIMKRSKYIVIVVLVLCCMHVFALSPSDLTADERFIFDSQAISIQTSESITYYSDIWGSPRYWDVTWNSSKDSVSDAAWLLFALPYTFVSSVTHGKTETKWEPYQGFNKISKYEFYNLLGLKEEAKRYENFLNRRKTWNVMTWSNLALGAGLMIAGLCVEEEPVQNWLFLSSGVAFTISSVGFAVLEFGLVESNEFSVTFAVNAAQTYNQRLLEDLSK